MNSIQQLFRTHGAAYLERFGGAMPANHKKVIHAIRNCGTGAFGQHSFSCDGCGESHYADSSCGNRHCPTCQGGKSDEWLNKQLGKALPVNYFMITVTVPSELRELIRSNQKVAYAALFKAGSSAIKKLAKDERHIGCHTAGLTGILHTWTRQLEYHPHVHFIVPGGGISPDGKRWLPAQRDFLMPERAVAKILRAKFRDALKKHPDVFKQIPKKVWRTDWVVDIEPVGKGTSALKYLAPYIFRVAISNKRIVRFKDQKVTFRYQDNKGKWHTPTLEAEKFISRFLQHVLPYRFVKVRYYGFLSPRKRKLLETIKELFGLFTREEEKSGSGCCLAAEARVMRCPKCGGQMVFVREIRPQKHLLNLSNEWRPP